MFISSKLVGIVGAVALAAGLAAVAAPAAGGLARPSPHDATNDTVQCNDLIGKIEFIGLPKLTADGTTPVPTEIIAYSDDCSSASAGAYNADTNPNGLSISRATIRGTLNPITNCVDLFGLSTPTEGLSTGAEPPLHIGWSAPPNTPNVVDRNTLVDITQTWLGEFNDGDSTSPATASASWDSTYFYFSLGAFDSGLPLGSSQSYTAAPSITGSFQGGDGGATSTLQVTSNQSLGGIAAECFGSGVRSIAFGIGGFTLK